MKRLNKGSFDGFLSEQSVAAVLFVAPRGEASMRQALNFAEAWAEHPHARYGYVNAFREVALARYFDIRVLPTTLVLRDGEEVMRLEGRHCALSIGSAVDNAVNSLAPGSETRACQS